MDGPQLLVYLGWVAFNAYAEGYRGFQKGFSPRVVERAFALARDPSPLRVALAPGYCMSLFAAPARRMLISWTLSVAIVALVILVRGLAQPWRGIVDAGVVVGLAWGAVTVAALFVKTLVALRPAP